MFDGEEEFLHGLKISSLISKPHVFIVSGLVLPWHLNWWPLDSIPLCAVPTMRQPWRMDVAHLLSTAFWECHECQQIYQDLTHFDSSWSRLVHFTFYSWVINFCFDLEHWRAPYIDKSIFNSPMDFVMLVSVPKLWWIQKVIMSLLAFYKIF